MGVETEAMVFVTIEEEGEAEVLIRGDYGSLEGVVRQLSGITRRA